MGLSRDELIYLSKVCEQTERFEDMVEYMKQVVNNFSEELSVEERNLLSVAYKNAVGSRRTAWRVVTSIENKEESKGSKHGHLLKDYKVKIEKELESICNEITGILDSKLIANAAKSEVKQSAGESKSVAESQVFYLKMKADYYRYISEYSGERNPKAAEKASEAYLAAKEIACQHLNTTNPIRLGLALNFSVFYYEVNNDPKKACELAKTAFEEALADIEGIEEDNYKDSTTIMQLIRDNLTLWTSELDEGSDANK
jgi:14-3-3 protein epsilon